MAKGSEGANKFFRVLGIIGASLMILSALALSTFLILDIAGVNILLMEEPRYYSVGFYSEDNPISTAVLRRGDKITKPSEKPTHSYVKNWEFSFQGWDINSDGRVDVIPPYAYYSFDADAIYSKKYTGPKDPKTGKPIEEEPAGENNGR